MTIRLLIFCNINSLISEAPTSVARMTYCRVNSFSFGSGNYYGTYLTASLRELIRGQVIRCNLPIFQGMLCSQVISICPNLTFMNVCSPR